jgi:hypothetical protein
MRTSPNHVQIILLGFSLQIGQQNEMAIFAVFRFRSAFGRRSGKG